MDDELTPQQEERVRRLLAEARHTEPMPADVADRLDRVIAGLAAEPDTAPTGAPVVRLAERRRRAGRLLLAAAAVVVGGVAVGQVVGGSGGSDEAMSGADSAADEERGLPAPDRARENALTDQPRGDSDGGDVPGAVAETLRSVSRLPAQRVRPGRFPADAARVRALATGRAKAQSTRRDAPYLSSGAATSCPPGAWGGGRYVRIGFGSRAGWMVFRPPRGGTQVAEVFLCGEDSPVRSATLPFE